MRPRLIQEVPGLDPAASPFERFENFVRRIAAVPKSELEGEIKKSADKASVRAIAKRAGKKREE